MTKDEAIELYGGASALAAALEISRQAVHKWPDGDIHEKYDLKIRFVLRPKGLKALLAKSTEVNSRDVT